MVFPRHRNAKKPKAMDASAEACQTATQHTGTIMPITKAAPALEKVAITEEMKVCVWGGGCLGVGVVGGMAWVVLSGKLGCLRNQGFLVVQLVS